jgi:regulator of ribosome biosynthesis
MYLSAHTLTARLGTRGRFAKEKGIQNKKKERMVMDERTGEWAPRWGYKRRENPDDSGPPIVEAGPRDDGSVRARGASARTRAALPARSALGGTPRAAGRMCSLLCTGPA